MATRIDQRSPLFQMQMPPVALPSRRVMSDHPLSESALFHLNSLLVPPQGYHYCYQKITPHARLTLLEFSFDLVRFIQQLGECCATRGIAIKSVCLTKEAGHTILIKKEGVPSALNLEIQIESVNTPTDVDAAILTALQKTAERASHREVSYEFFKDYGLKPPYASFAENNVSFSIPVKRGETECSLNFTVFSSRNNGCISSADSFQVDLFSYLLGEGKTPCASAMDGYDFQEACALIQKGQFEIQPARAAGLPDGACSYIDLLTGGKMPRSMKAERGLWEGFLRCYSNPERLEVLRSKLQDHLETHYKNDLIGALVFLLNMADFIARAPQGSEKRAMRAVIAELLAKQLCVQTSVEPDLFLAHCIVHLFLFFLKDAGKSKFYFDESNDPLYRMRCEGRQISLFTEFPVESLTVVFSHWKECRDVQGVLEKEFPLEAFKYQGRACTYLASVGRADYPMHAAALDVLRAVCGEQTIDIPRFLKGMMRRIASLRDREERVQLVENELAIFNLFHKGAPLSLDQLKADPDNCEEAIMGEFCLSEDPLYVSLALELVEQVLKKGGCPPVVIQLLQNPLVVADPRGKVLYQRVCTLQMQERDPRAHLSLFLLYHQLGVEAKELEEDSFFLQRLLVLNRNPGVILTPTEKKRLEEISFGIISTLAERNLPLVLSLFEALVSSPPLIDEACTRILSQRLASSLLASSNPQVFASGKEFLRKRIEGKDILPLGVAESVARAVEGVKDVPRFKEVIELIGELEGEYFSAESRNIEECMRRACRQFPSCLCEVAVLARGVTQEKRGEWIKEVVKLKSHSAFVSCTTILENREVFGFLEEDYPFWKGYIELEVSLKGKHSQAVVAYLRKEEGLLKHLDVDSFTTLFLKMISLLPQEAEAQEKRFSQLFDKLIKGGTIENKVASLSPFIKQFGVICSDTLALQSIQVLSILNVKHLKTEGGFSLLSQFVDFLGKRPKTEKFMRSLLGIFHKVRDSLDFTEVHIYSPMAQNLIGMLRDTYQLPRETEGALQSWCMDQALAILRFSVEKNAFTEELFYEELKNVLVLHKEHFSLGDLKTLLKLAADAASSYKISSQEPFFSIVLPLFEIAKGLLVRATTDAVVQNLGVLWCHFCQGQQKRCGRTHRRIVSALAMTEIQVLSLSALKMLKLPYTNGHVVSGETDSQNRRGQPEAELAVRCFAQAVETPIFFHVSHMRQAFTELSRAMLEYPSLRTQILPLMTTRNFTGRDYLELIHRSVQSCQESPDPFHPKAIYQIASYLFLHQDLGQALSNEEIKYVVEGIGLFAWQQLQKFPDSLEALKYSVGTLQLVLRAAKIFPVVGEQCRESEEAEFLPFISFVFNRIVEMENRVLLANFAKCLEEIQQNCIVRDQEAIGEMLGKIPQLQEILAKTAQLKRAIVLESRE